MRKTTRQVLVTVTWLAIGLSLVTALGIPSGSQAWWLLAGVPAAVIALMLAASIPIIWVAFFLALVSSCGSKR